MSLARIRTWLVLAAIAAFGGFAWFSLPGLDEAQAPDAPGRTARGSGVVVGVDRERGVVTISHGPLPTLNMGPMTMGFPVRDRSRLFDLRPTQRVEFELAFDGRDYTITEIR